MRLFGTRTLREREIRKTLAEYMPTWYERLLDPVRPRPLLIVVVCAVVAAVVTNLGDDPLGLQVGQRVPRAITARVPIRDEDRERTQLMRTRAAETAPEYFTLDESLLTEIRGRFGSVLRLAREHGGDVRKIIDAAAAINMTIDEPAAKELAKQASAQNSSGYERMVDRAVDALRREPLIESEESSKARRAALTAILVDTEGATQRELSIHKLLFSSSREDVLRCIDSACEAFPSTLRPGLKTALLAIFRGDSDERFKPLYRYDETASARAADQASAQVPMQYIDLGVDSRLADAGDITPDELRLLEMEHRRYRAMTETDPALASALRWQTLSRALLAFFVVLGAGGAIVLRHDAPSGGTHQQIATAATLVVALIACRTVALFTSQPYLCVGIQAFVVFLLAITTSGRVAAVATSALFALIAAFATRQGLAFLSILAVVSVGPFLGLRDVRHRGRIIAVGFVTAIIALVATLVVGVSEGQSVEFVARHRALWAAVGTLAAAFLVEGLLPGIERFFGVTTNMTLLEWCDPNKPLLRMMAQEAPGTYNHSLVVGTLADAASEAIEANGLLARAGAYYHDIGKINKPEYFVENQDPGTGNRHERLTPAMSHLVITGHVKNGLAMAREYALPAPLHAFIPEHHGTCVVEYFFHAANRARKPGDPEIRDDQFRYPGPKPQSRETAIVMLCDSVEGAVRAMPEPTPGRIEDTVARIINKRLADGQLDECDLTFRELAEIRQSLVKSLCSIYHGRIRYPSDEKHEEDEDAQARASDADAPSAPRDERSAG